MKIKPFVILSIISTIVLSSCNNLPSKNSSSNSSDPMSETTNSSESTSQIPTYTVTWLHSDGRVLEIDNDVIEGSYPSFDGDIPTINPTPHHRYIFIGWSPEREPVFSDQTYTAKFTTALIYYTITWVDYDDKVLEKDEYMEYGVLPTYDANPPKRSGNEIHSYVFSGWDPEVKAVSKNQTYKAQYEQVPTMYRVTWLGADNEVLKVESLPYGAIPNYGGEDPEGYAHGLITYSFDYWYPDITPVTEDITYQAIYINDLENLTVTWLDEDGTTLLVDTRQTWGYYPPPNDLAPTKPETDEFIYEFIGWEPEIGPIKGHDVYTAVYKTTVKTYEITWLDDDGTVLFVENVAYGTLPVYPYDLPTKEGDVEHYYTFAGWDQRITTVDGPRTYRATYTTETNVFRVEWVNEDGSLIYEDRAVLYGTIPVFPFEEPKRTNDAQYSYEFAGWSPAFTEVVSNQTYTAIFTKKLNTYTVRWLDENDNILVVDNDVDYGTTPAYLQLPPVKEDSNGFVYYFSGWSPEISVVESDQTYRPVYLAEAQYYNVTWLDDEGNVLSISQNISYGSIPFNNNIPEKISKTPGITYTFAGWSPNLKPITENTTYQATFTTSYDNEDVFEYKNKEDGLIEITGFKDKQVSALTIPSTIDGKTVAYIGDYAFAYFTKLKVLNLPETIQKIGDEAFAATGIQKLDITANITEIGNRSFANCLALQELTIASGNTRVMPDTFLNLTSLVKLSIPNDVDYSFTRSISGFKNLTLSIFGSGNVYLDMDSLYYGLNEVIFEEGITSISEFSRMKKLTAISLPSTLTSIGEYVFSHCSILTNVTLPANLKTIGAYAFSECPNLINVDFNEELEEVGRNAFENCTSLKTAVFGQNLKIIDQQAFFNNKSLETILLPLNIQTIANNAFSGSNNIKNINIPNHLLKGFLKNHPNINLQSLTITGEGVISDYNLSSFPSLQEVVLDGNFSTIESRAFANLPNLTKVILSEGLLILESQAFADNPKLQTIYLPNTIVTISSEAFRNCESLQTVALPESLSELGSGAFQGCSVLKEITIPNEVKVLDDFLFYGCTGLERIYLPSDITKIGDSTFYNCFRLEYICLGKELTSIGRAAFANCSSLVEVVLPTTLTRIEESTFKSCYNLETVILPETILYIGKSAFMYAIKLANINLPSSLIEIGDEAFSDCLNLSEIIIPTSLLKIGNSAFRYCKKLQNFSLGNTLKEIGNEAFYGCDLLESIIIPTSVTKLGNGAFYLCQNLKNITIPVSLSGSFTKVFNGFNLRITIKGDGKIANSAFDIREKNNITINEINLSQANITEIGEYAFAGNIYLTNIYLFESLTTIDVFAFLDCYNLENIVIPNSVTRIGYGAFFNCRSFTKFVVPLNVSVIPVANQNYYYGIINSFENLIDIYVPNCQHISYYISAIYTVNDQLTITIYGSGELINNFASGRSYYCHFVIDEGITSLGVASFSGTLGILSLKLPNSLTSIGNRAFENCLWLKNIVLPSGLKTISEQAFYRSSELLAIEIPESVTTIGYGAFSECTKLAAVTLSVNQLNNLQSGTFPAQLRVLTINGSGQLNSNSLSKIPSVVTLKLGKDVKIADTGLVTNSSVLEGVEIDPLNNYYVTIDGVVYSKDGSVLLYYPHNRSDYEFIVPSTVTTIAENAFRNVKNLRKIIIPDSVLYISISNFSTCPNLKTISIPVHLTQNAKSMFVNHGLMIILTGEGAIISNYWDNFTNLVTLVIGPGINEIGDNAFKGSGSLITVEIADDNPFYTISEGVIYTKDGKTLVHYLPNNTSSTLFLSALLTTILPGALDYATNLSFIIVDSQNEVYMSQDGVLYNKAGTKVILYPAQSPIINYVIPDTLTEINAEYFLNFFSIQSYSVSEDNLYFKTIDGILYNKDGSVLLLYPQGRKNTYFKVPASVVAINENAFGVNSIKTLVFDTNSFNKLESLGGYFKNITVIIEGSGVITNSSLLANIDGKINLIISDEVSHINYGTFMNSPRVNALSIDIKFIPAFNQIFGGFGQLDLTISGEGIIPAMIFSSKYWLKTLTLGDGITEIANSAFHNCQELTSISLPLTLIKIGSSAFASCGKLNNVIIPLSVTSLGGYSFYSCSNLRKVTIPTHLCPVYNQNFNTEYMFLTINGVGEVPSGSFIGTSRISSLSFGDEVTSLGDNDYGIPQYLHIGASISTVNFSSFFNVISLTLSPNNPNFRTIEGSIYSDDLKTLYFYNSVEKANTFIIPYGVETIVKGAFSNHSELITIFMPNTVKHILGSAFSNCSNLRNIFSYDYAKKIDLEMLNLNETSASINLPEGLLTIEAYAFERCSSIEQVILPQSLISVGLLAFANCNSLTKLSIPHTLAPYFYSLIGKDKAFLELTLTGSGKIADYAFRRDDIYNQKVGELSLIISGTISRIGYGAFMECDFITSINLGTNNLTIEDEAFSGVQITSLIIPENISFSGNKGFGYALFTVTELVVHVNGLKGLISTEFYSNIIHVTIIGNGVIPEAAFTNFRGAFVITINEGVTAIGVNAFKGCVGLENLILPQSITEIGKGAFEGCVGLENLILPQSITEIGKGAFEGCVNLKSINIPTNIKIIDDTTFRNCYSLVSINIPQNVEVIGNEAFANCESLININLPENLKIIGNSTFRNCNSLTSLSIPNNLEKIGSYAFSFCSNLRSIIIPSEITFIAEYTFFRCYSLEVVSFPTSLIAIEQYAFSHCYALKNIALPSTLQTIGKNAFSECKGLTQLDLVEGIKIIDDYAFMDCSSLLTVTLPSTLTELGIHTFANNVKLVNVVIHGPLANIGSYTFANCSQLNSVFIPHTITKIDDFAFVNCSNLHELVLPQSVEFIGNSAFMGCHSLSKINLDKVTHIGDSAFMECLSLSEINLDKATHIGNTAFMECLSLSEINLDKVTYIGDYAFYHLESLQAINLPDTLVKIGQYAFAGCTKVEKIILPESLTQIGVDAFSGLLNIKDFTYSLNHCFFIDEMIKNSNNKLTLTINGTGSLEDYQYENNENIIKVTLLDGITAVASYTFSNCINLEVADLGSGLIHIDYSAFMGCEKLRSIEIPDSVIIIRPYAFANCFALKQLSLSSNLEEIGAYAFSNCTNLEDFILPENLNAIGSGAFQNCMNLTKVVIPNKVVVLGEYIFRNCINLREVEITRTESGTSSYVECFSNIPGLKTLIVTPNTVNLVVNARFSSMIALIIRGNGITRVESWNGQQWLESLIIEEGVTELGVSFRNCQNLNQVVLPNSLTSFSYTNTFYQSNNIRYLSLPVHLLSTASSQGLRSGRIYVLTITGSGVLNRVPTVFGVIQKIILGDDITAISGSAFTDVKVVEIYAGSNLDLVEELGFSTRNYYLTTVHLNANITSISAGAFLWSYGLKSIIVPEENKYYRSNTGVLYSKDLSTLVAYPSGKNDARFIVPSGVVIIDKYAFSDVKALREIIFPNTLVMIGDMAFNSCSKLHIVTLPMSVQEIGYGAFSGCFHLYAINLDYVLLLGENVFEGCSNLQIKSFNYDSWVSNVFRRDGEDNN